MKNPFYEFASWAIGPFPFLAAGVGMVMVALFFATLKLWSLRHATTNDVRVWMRLSSYILLFIGLALWLGKIAADKEPPLYGYNVVILLALTIAPLSVIYDPKKPLIPWMPFLTDRDDEGKEESP